MVDIPGLTAQNFMGIFSQAMMWVKYIIYGVGISIALWTAYLYMTYNIKADEFRTFGSGKDGVYSVAKRRKNRIKWVNNRTGWKTLFPLFNKNEIEPFSQEYVYPGNQVYAFIVDNVWVPGRININKNEDKLKAEISPVPYYVRRWQSLQHKKNAQEYAEHNSWEDNKHMIITISVIILCLILCGATVYFTYKFGIPKGEINNLANALKSMVEVPSVGG